MTVVSIMKKILGRWKKWTIKCIAIIEQFDLIANDGNLCVNS